MINHDMHTVPAGIFRRISNHRTAQGIAMPIVLLALLFMSIAAVGLIRMVDTSTLVAGNLAFKQATTSIADRGAEEAVAFLTGKATHVDQNIRNELLQPIPAAPYYFPSFSDPVDPSSLGVAGSNEFDITAKTASPTRVVPDWQGDGCASIGAYQKCATTAAVSVVPLPDGYAARYMIVRMSSKKGSCGGDIVCVMPVAAQSGDVEHVNDCLDNEMEEHCSERGGSSTTAVTDQPYYRIIVRATGPRNTVSFTETYVHFDGGS